MRGYGGRYLSAREFSDYCSGLNVELSSLGFPELQLYEREGLLLPMARVIQPPEYVIKRWQLDQQPETYGQNLPEWNELERLLYGTRSDLWHLFDREFERGNRFLSRPTDNAFSPWGSFYAEVELASGDTVRLSSAEHYYHYWQVHQAYEIQRKYPVFAKYNWVLQNLKDEAKKEAYFLKPPDSTPIATLYGRAKYFDALSFYIELYNNEEERAFAAVPVTDGFKKLSDEQSAHYQSQLIGHAKFVYGRYSLSVEGLYGFLVHVLNLQTRYEDDDHTKLANELENDIVFLAKFIAGLTGQSFSELEEEIGKRASSWTRKQFRHLDKALEVQDYAREAFERLMGEYNERFPGFAISATDISRLLRFLDDKGLFIIPYAIFDIDRALNNRRPFLRTLLYGGLRNLTTGLECFLREIANTVPSSTVDTSKLYQLIITMFGEWGKTFDVEHQAKNRIHRHDAISYIADVYTDPNLDEPVRVFLIARQVRNLVAHQYILEHELYYGLYVM
jgi:hypothetical protein